MRLREPSPNLPAINMKTFKLIQSGSNNAEYNMALDEQIFNRYLDDGVGVFRIYGWEEPSFTYGFSQRPQEEIDLERCAADGIQVAKRITGGGILFHDDEITYSFVCGKDDISEPQGVFVAYRQICKFLIRFYESLGLAPGFALETKDFKQKCAPHELCSAAYEKYDIVITGRKIGGNAQKRKRQVVFQHGSIPLSVNWDFMRRYLQTFPDNISASVTTLKELGIVLPQDALEQKLIEAFGSTFNLNFIEERGSVYETCLA